MAQFWSLKYGGTPRSHQEEKTVKSLAVDRYQSTIILMSGERIFVKRQRSLVGENIGGILRESHEGGDVGGHASHDRRSQQHRHP